MPQRKKNKKLVKKPTASAGSKSPSAEHCDQLYAIEKQVGFLLRRAHQRSSAIFQELFSGSGLTPLQFSTLVKIRDEGRISQNRLGRLAYADPATIMGVINRLVERQMIRKSPDPIDKRKSVLILSSKGLNLIESMELHALDVSKKTLEPLTKSEQTTFLKLLDRLR